MFTTILGHAGVYSLFARLVGTKRGRRMYIDRYVRPRTGDRILDIGCGPADILEALPRVEYHGFDISDVYIAAARKRFGSRGRFEIAAVTPDLVKKYTAFDLVLATGVLHHLTDAEAVDLFRVAKAALKPGGRLVTLDGCRTAHQSRIARYLLSNDRGRYVREEAAYVALARKVFSNVAGTVTSDLLRVPYTHLVLECTQERPQDAP